MQREKKKVLNDEEVIKLLKKLRKNEIETIKLQGFDIKTHTSSYLLVLARYIPLEATEEEIESWIANNISFSALPNKMAAMKTIMKHFGSRADGRKVKAVLENIK